MESPKIFAALITAITSLLIAGSTYYSSWKNKRNLELLKSSLGKKERLEVSRKEGYEDIWNLTGNFNLFGPWTEPDIDHLSGRLKDWYFEHGMILGMDSKSRYFLLQEILAVAKLKNYSFKRPGEDILYGSEDLTTEALKDLRKKYFGIETNSGNVNLLGSYVRRWKGTDYGRIKGSEEHNWILFQLILSKFRSGLIDDLGF